MPFGRRLRLKQAETTLRKPDYRELELMNALKEGTRNTMLDKIHLQEEVGKDREIVRKHALPDRCYRAADQKQADAVARCLSSGRLRLKVYYALSVETVFG